MPAFLCQGCVFKINALCHFISGCAAVIGIVKEFSMRYWCFSVLRKFLNLLDQLIIQSINEKYLSYFMAEILFLQKQQRNGIVEVSEASFKSLGSV